MPGVDHGAPSTGPSAHGPALDGPSDGNGPVVGVIGLGVIGAGVTEALLRAGHRTVVRDVRPDATAAFAGRATVAGSAADLLAACDVVLVAVVDDDQLVDVLMGDGGLDRAGPGTAVVVLSTVSFDCLGRVRRAAEAAGVDLVDCGVSGGPQAAARGDLVCIVGGTEAAAARVRPVLDAFSSTVVHVGGSGAGLATKLARNLVQYGCWLAALEGQRLAEAAGVPLTRLAEVIRAADARAGGPTALMFRASATPFGETDDAGLVDAMRGAAALARKDMRAALALAGELGVAIPGAVMTEQRCEEIFYLVGPPEGQPVPDPAP